MLVGGATGLIGDPKMAGERTLNPVDLVHEWVERIRAQIEPFMSFEGDNPARMVNNYDWTKDLSRDRAAARHRQATTGSAR